ncbi:MAG TPA: hypothetical protein DCZ94_01120 [Lentisphaeria bacterium]|nr:MAG: hypothetical protein A2X48_11655 [Lentisphaerae bacterium GWF2_49_21]HBC85532.1 hypothetical protein [Lentisphaeria bacterium]
MVDKKVIIGSTSDSVVKPGDVTRITPAAGMDEDSVETSNIARIKTPEEQAQQPKKTIKLKPVTVGDATAAGDASGNPAQEDETVKIQKPRPVATPTVPGVKQTIKLRPSSNTPAPDATEGAGAPPQMMAPPPQAAVPADSAPSAKRTIRLVPKKADATSNGEAAAARPSAPTVKLEEPQQAAAPSARSAATVKLDGGDASAQSAPPKRTLKLRPVKSGEPAAAPAMPSPSPAGATDSEMAAMAAGDQSMPPVAQAQQESMGAPEKGHDEPSMIFTLAAGLALFTMIYFTWMIVGQYCNNYLETKITVPGLTK